MRSRVAVVAAFLAALVVAVPAFGGAFEPLGSWADGGAVGPQVDGLAADADGGIAVADRQRDAITRFSYDRTAAPGFAADDPRGIAAVPGGGYVITEAGGARRVTASGATLKTYAAGDPTGVAVLNGTVLIADAADGRILRYTLGGAALTAWEAGLTDPVALAIGPGGTVYATDANAGRVEIFGSDGSDAGGWGTPDPHGVAVAADGTVYVAAHSDHELRIFSPEGTLLRTIGGLNRPGGVTIDCRGIVTVADNSSERLNAYGDPAAAPPPCLAPTPTPTPEATPTALPELGETAVARPLSGVVYIGTGKARRRLTERRVIGMGTRVGARDGRVSLVFETAATDVARYGASQDVVLRDGAFRIHQGRKGSVAELRLVGAAPAVNDAARISARRKRRLWGSARGRFRTSGRHGAATVRGTRWLTEDLSSGTLIRVTEGSVIARAFETGERRVVAAGERFLARPGCAGRRFRIPLRVPPGARLRSARVRVDGRLVSRSLTRRIRLRAGRHVVSVRIRYVTNARIAVTERARYETC